MNYRPLNAEERSVLAALRTAGFKQTEIAPKLGGHSWVAHAPSCEVFGGRTNSPFGACAGAGGESAGAPIPAREGACATQCHCMEPAQTGDSHSLLEYCLKLTNLMPGTNAGN